MSISANDGVITFNAEKDPSISSYETISWKVNEFHDVEFFPNKITRVYLISNQNRDMENILKQLETDDDDDHKNSQDISTIAIDLEWEYGKLCLIQFCANNICVIIRLFTDEDLQNHPELILYGEDDFALLQKNNQILKGFLNTHKFYGKGMHNDKKMLLTYFDSSFSNNFEDIEKTRLSPYNLSRNFNQMTLKFAGEPTASFKVIEMTKSDWSVPELSFRQVLYAAFDTVALFYCYPNFPPIPTSNEINQKQKTKMKQKQEIQDSNQPQKVKQKPNIKYYKTKCSSKNDNDNDNDNENNKKANKKKGPKMNLSVIFKKREKKETFSYLVKNYQGTKNKLILRTLFPNLDFISYFDSNATSYLFISSFSQINDFSNVLNSEKCIFENHQNISIEIKDPDEPLSCEKFVKLSEDVLYLPKVPFHLCNDTDVLFLTNIPISIFSEEKLQELLYCFGFDQIVSRIDDKYQNACIIEPRNAEISKRIRTFLPFVKIDDFLLKVYEYPTFLRTVRMSNIPSNFTEDNLKELFITGDSELDRSDDDYLSKLNQLTLVESTEFILRRIEKDSKTAYVIFKTLQDKKYCTEKFNRFKLKKLIEIKNFENFDLSEIDDDDEFLIIPFSSDVHLRYLRSYELNVYLKNQSNANFDDLYKAFQKFGKILQMNYDKRFSNFHIQYYRKCDAINAYNYVSKKNGSIITLRNERSSEYKQSNTNENEKSNTNENEKSNTNENTNENENSHTNENEKSNTNENENSNTSEYKQSNTNENEKSNTNENTNENENSNANESKHGISHNNEIDDNNNNDWDENNLNERRSICAGCFSDADDRLFGQVIIEMHPDGSTVIVRDLPMEIEEPELIKVFSKFGRITNLVFRDLTPMNMLSVVDIFFSSADEAKDVKKSMNKVKVGGTSIHVSIRSREDITDWKMSQRNQWVIFDDCYKTLDDVFSKTIKYGKIIDYNYENDHFLAMFDNQENAKTVIDELGLSYPTYAQFVNETNNSNYLQIVQKPSIPGNPTGPKEAAIVVDPIPDNLTEDYIEKIFCEGNATSADEASSIVLASSLILPPLKDIVKPSSKNSNSDEIECEYPHELFITDSVKFKGQKRLVVYSPSNNVTKKLFTLLVNSEFEGKYFKPKRIDVQDLENPPPKKNTKNVFEGHVVTNPVVVIDPLPNGFGDKEIRETINELPNFEMVICQSSIIKGKLRAVLMPKLASQRRIMLKALSLKIVNNENLHVFKYKCDSIPPSI